MFKLFKKFDFILYVELLLLAVCIYFGIRNTNFYLVAISLTVVSVAFGGHKHVFSQLFFLLPFAMIYKMSSTSTSLFTIGYILSTAIILLRYAIGKGFTNGKCVNPKLIPLLSALTLYLFPGAVDDFQAMIKLVCGFVLLLVFIQVCNPEESVDYIISYSCGFLFSSYLGLSKLSNPLINQYFKGGNSEYIGGESVVRFSGLFEDPNYYSIGVIIAIFLLVRVFLSLKKPLLKFFCFLLAGGLTYFGLITYSRIYYIALLMLVVYFVIQSKSKVLTIAFVLVLSVAIAPVILNSTIYSNIMNRFMDDDISNGRLQIWSRYLNNIFSSPVSILFGQGVGAKLVGGTGCHNTYIELLYTVGFFGGVIYLRLIIKTMRQKGSMLHSLMDRLLLPTIFCVMIFTLGCLKTIEFQFYLMMLWISYYLDFKILDVKN